MNCPCDGTGIVGGELGGPNAGPWKSCSCPAGDNPRLFERIREANSARDKILARSLETQFRSQVKTSRQYHGPQFHTPLEKEPAGMAHATRDAKP